MLTISGCAAGADGDSGAAPVAAGDGEPRRLTVRVGATYPHDPEAFTQGLLWHQGSLYESVGQYGRSAVRRVDLETGRVEVEQRLPAPVFGEGLALLDGELYQLTWHAGRGFRWTVEDLADRPGFTYSGQGWGLCAAAGDLVRSDGTARLTIHAAGSFEPVRALVVERSGVPQGNLNELECVDGWIYANVWTTEEIVRIDPATGRVTAVIDASGLLTESERRGVDVLNGIAYYPPNRTFLLTGKYWPKLFEVEFVEAAP